MDLFDYYILLKDDQLKEDYIGLMKEEWLSKIIISPIDWRLDSL